MPQTEKQDIKGGEDSLRLKSRPQQSGEEASGFYGGGINSENAFLKHLAENMEQNQQMLAKVYKTSEKIRKYLLWIHVSNIFKTLLIVIPLLLSIIYLPQLLKGLFPTLDENLSGKETGGLMQKLNPKEVVKSYEEIFSE
jgi:hypothetical protein